MNSKPVTDFNPSLFRQHRNNGHVVDGVAGQEHQFPVNAGGHSTPLIITEMFHCQGRIRRPISKAPQRIDDGKKSVAGSVVIQLKAFLTLPFLVIEWPCGLPVNSSQKGHVMVNDVAHVFTDYMLFFRSERLPIQLSRHHNKQLCKLIDGVGIFGNELFAINRPGT